MQASTPPSRKRKVDSISQLEGRGEDSEGDRLVEEPAKRVRVLPSESDPSADETGHNAAIANPGAFYHPSAGVRSNMSSPPAAAKLSSLRQSGGLAKAPAKKISVNIRTSGSFSFLSAKLPFARTRQPATVYR